MPLTRLPPLTLIQQRRDSSSSDAPVVHDSLRLQLLDGPAYRHDARKHGNASDSREERNCRPEEAIVWPRNADDGKCRQRRVIDNWALTFSRPLLLSV